MQHNLAKIGFGGGCHWCTEAIFQSIKGVQKVEQGWIRSEIPNDTFSEAVIVYYDKEEMELITLLQIHLQTHSSTSQHSMRNKYRSAIYTFSKVQAQSISKLLRILQQDFDQPLITKVLPFVAFKENSEQYQNYYYSNPQLPFCQTYIVPKLSVLQKRFSHIVAKPKRD